MVEIYGCKFQQTNPNFVAFLKLVKSKVRSPIAQVKNVDFFQNRIGSYFKQKSLFARPLIEKILKFSPL